MGYVGLSLAVLLSKEHNVTVVEVAKDKVDLLNSWKSPIKDDYIEKYLAEHEARGLKLTATTDGESAYAKADYVIIAVPTNYDPEKNFFDCSIVENVVGLAVKCSDTSTLVIKSTIPVGYTESMNRKLGKERVLFSPEFLRESKALYDNLYPSRIIVGCADSLKEKAEVFSAFLFLYPE